VPPLLALTIVAFQQRESRPTAGRTASVFAFAAGRSGRFWAEPHGWLWDACPDGS